jgi:UDP-N-acetyl-2-amino-2-deoxyglucuronate dehydrogenase
MEKKIVLKFALIGLGYIAHRHIRAIKEIGGELVAVYEPCHEVAGILDSYFPECELYYQNAAINFVETINSIDYVVICSPNYTHAPYIISLSQYHDTKIICEKPIAINTAQLDSIENFDINCINQMRLHPAVKEIKLEDYNNVKIEYITPRGKWYKSTWKMDKSQSGGILFNIGSHLFDMCSMLFGKSLSYHDLNIKDRYAEGLINYKNASVAFKLSIDGPERKRIFNINDIDYDFTTGFEDLHTESYRKIIKGEGFKLPDVYDGLKTIMDIRDNIK